MVAGAGWVDFIVSRAFIFRSYIGTVLCISSLNLLNLGKNLKSFVPLKVISWFTGKPPLHESPSWIYKFPIFWSTSNVPMLLSSWNPGAKSFVPLKNVICTSVFSCWVNEVSEILFDKKFFYYRKKYIHL